MPGIGVEGETKGVADETRDWCWFWNKVPSSQTQRMRKGSHDNGALWVSELLLGLSTEHVVVAPFAFTFRASGLLCSQFLRFGFGEVPSEMDKGMSRSKTTSLSFFF